MHFLDCHLENRNTGKESATANTIKTHIETLAYAKDGIRGTSFTLSSLATLPLPPVPYQKILKTRKKYIKQQFSGHYSHQAIKYSHP